MSSLRSAFLLLGLAACSSTATAPGQAEDEQTAWRAPAAGSCEEGAMIDLANEATIDALDGELGLDRRAAENIVAARPITTIAELDAVSFVGNAALSAIFEQAKKTCEGGGGALPPPSNGNPGELGIVSDLDKTVIPEATPDLSKAPYPGVKKLYDILEHRSGGAAGDMHYVTARVPEKILDVPAYLAEHGIPAGDYETGTSGVPWVAQAEKVRDINAIFARTGTQKFVLFGDTSHRDPEVYKEILAAHPDRVIGGFIHKVNATVSPDRLTGLHLYESYAELAAILYGLDVITRAEALEVMRSASEEGLELTDDEMQSLLSAHEG